MTPAPVSSQTLAQIKEMLMTKMTYGEISRVTGQSPQRISMFAVAWELTRPRGRKAKWKPRELIEN